MDDESVAVAPAIPLVQLHKTIEEIIDTNGTDRIDAGDTVVYRFEVTNTGNQTLETIELIDPMVSFSTATIGPLLPTQSNSTLTATYVLLQSDIDAGGLENSASALGTPPLDINGDPQPPAEDVSDPGDELAETAALDGSTDGDPTNDPTVLALEQIIDMDIQKSLIALEQPFPFVFDLTYQVSVENTGNVTATNVNLTDDIVGQFAPSTVMSVTLQNPEGILALVDLNADYDGGVAEVNVLETGLTLAPADQLSFEISVRVEVPPGFFSGGMAALENSATVSLDQSPTPLSSFANGTLGPVVTSFVDTDIDGILDIEEAHSPDRDGDSQSNQVDYDPTGYLYCEENGAILSGGVISVVSLSGTQDAIRVIHDGSNGVYQWYVVAEGTYEMTYTLPPDVAASVDRLPGGVLYTSSFSGDLISLGSNEADDSGVLADHSAGANPYHLIFEISEGDPHVINNNIPFRHCGTPALTVSKTIADGSTPVDASRTSLTYEITVENDGDSRAANLGLDDALDGVFGAGQFEIVSVNLTDAPTAFSAVPNSSYNGISDTALLTGGGFLDPGENLTVELSVIVEPIETGNYVNTVTATGTTASGNAPLPEAQDSVEVLLFNDALLGDLLISKTAAPESVRAGDTVTYTIVVENTGPTDLAGLTLVDELPAGIRYQSGTAEIGGVPEEPVRDARRLEWSDFPIGSGQTRVVTLQTLVSSQAGPGDIVNNAWLENTQTGQRLTLIATATVRIALEPVFDCTNVIGKVFDDRNLNGYQDAPRDSRAQITDQTYVGDKLDREALELQQEEGEPGIPNVRIMTPTGTIITTDEFGRFSVPCAELPEASGTNFSLKVDERSLPTGYHIVTENPRTMRLTAGIFAEMNFGAALGNVVDIRLTSEAFSADGVPVPGLKDSLEALKEQVGSVHTVVNLAYYYRSEGAGEALRRLDLVEDLFNEVWRGAGSNALTIERAIYDAR